jgi:hypothetical protein
MITKNFTLTSSGPGVVATQIVSVDTVEGDYLATYKPRAAIIKVTPAGSTHADAIVKIFGSAVENETLSDGVILEAGVEYTFDRLEEAFYKISVESSASNKSATVRFSLLRYTRCDVEQVTNKVHQ